MKTLAPIEFNDQRILTTEQLAEVYETSSDNIKHNFSRNRKYFKKGIHYFLLQGDDLRDFKREVTDSPFALAPNVNQLYLWTERGASRHCKILDTEKAWEQFDNLEDTYFRVKEMPQFSSLSPQLQLLINIETEQNRQAAALKAMDSRIDRLGDVLAINPNGWRDDCRKMIVRIAHAMGGNEYIKDVQSEIFSLLDARFGVSLETRLTNMRRRMADEGVCKSKRDKMNKVDVVASDKKLIEGYIIIVKEMAIRYGVVD